MKWVPSIDKTVSRLARLLNTLETRGSGGLHSACASCYQLYQKEHKFQWNSNRKNNTFFQENLLKKPSAKCLLPLFCSNFNVSKQSKWSQHFGSTCIYPTQIAKTLGLTSLRYRSDPFAWDQCLFDVDPKVISICDTYHTWVHGDVAINENGVHHGDALSWCLGINDCIRGIMKSQGYAVIAVLDYDIMG